MRRTKENSISVKLNLVLCGGEEVAKSACGKMEERVLDGVIDVSRNGSEKGKNKAMELLKIVNARNARLESLSL